MPKKLRDIEQTRVCKSKSGGKNSISVYLLKKHRKPFWKQPIEKKKIPHQKKKHQNPKTYEVCHNQKKESWAKFTAYSM